MAGNYWLNCKAGDSTWEVGPFSTIGGAIEGRRERASETVRVQITNTRSAA